MELMASKGVKFMQALSLCVAKFYYRHRLEAHNQWQHRMQVGQNLLGELLAYGDENALKVGRRRVAVQYVVGHECHQAVGRHGIILQVEFDGGFSLQAHGKYRHVEYDRVVGQFHTVDVVKNKYFVVKVVLVGHVVEQRVDTSMM